MIATIVLGFSWGGWTTAGKARYAAEGMVSDAVAKRLAPICVVQFKADPDRAQKLKQLSEVSSYEKGDYVKKQGWATIAGEEGPNSRVADECVKLLAQTS
jgi:predicted DNA-binding protein (MmcQ/YjbR family)